MNGKIGNKILESYFTTENKKGFDRLSLGLVCSIKRVYKGPDGMNWAVGSDTEVNLPFSGYLVEADSDTKESAVKD